MWIPQRFPLDFFGHTSDPWTRPLVYQPRPQTKFTILYLSAGHPFDVWFALDS